MDISFFLNIYEHYGLISQKGWRHFKNDPAKQTLVKYSVLRVTYTKLSILNQLC